MVAFEGCGLERWLVAHLKITGQKLAVLAEFVRHIEHLHVRQGRRSDYFLSELPLHHLLPFFLYAFFFFVAGLTLVFGVFFRQRRTA